MRVFVRIDPDNNINFLGEYCHIRSLPNRKRIVGPAEIRVGGRSVMGHASNVRSGQAPSQINHLENSWV